MRQNTKEVSEISETEILHWKPLIAIKISRTKPYHYVYGLLTCHVPQHL